MKKRETQVRGDGSVEESHYIVYNVLNTRLPCMQIDLCSQDNQSKTPRVPSVSFVGKII